MATERRPIERPDLRGYEVSSRGDVFDPQGNKLTPWQDSRGKMTVTIGKYWYVVDRLVAMAFVECDDEKFLVRHLDGNENNCNADNLIWVGTPRKDAHIQYDMNDREGIQGWDENGLQERFDGIKDYCAHYGEGKTDEQVKMLGCNLRMAIKEGRQHHGLYWKCYEPSLLYVKGPYGKEDEVIDEDDTLNEIEPIVEDTIDEVIEDVEPTIEEDTTPAQDATPLPIVEPDIDEVIEEDEVKEEEPQPTTPAEDEPKGLGCWNETRRLHFNDMNEAVDYIIKEKGCPRKDVAGNIRKAIKADRIRYGYRWYCSNHSLLYASYPKRAEDAPQATQSHDVSEPIESATEEVKSEQRANDEVKEDTTPQQDATTKENREVRVVADGMEVIVKVKTSTKSIRIDLV